MKRIVIVLKVIQKCDGPLTPAITKLFNKIKEASSECTVDWNGAGLFQVKVFNKWYQSLERNFDLRRISFKLHFTFIVQFTKRDHQYPTVAKKPVLDTGKFEQWQFRIQQYLQHEHYALWEVIEFGDSYKVPTNTDLNDTSRRKDDEQSGRTVTITTEDMRRKKNDVKARTTLLLSLPDEHQLRFSKYKTAKELWAAILKTFGGCSKHMTGNLKLLINFVWKFMGIYKFPLPVKVVATAKRLEMPLPVVCTAIEEKKKKLPAKDRWQLH
nr:ribonuclease H-like domain-containing protein [Tanacetum cinerariifolium]